jgi:hypothetical protein
MTISRLGCAAAILLLGCSYNVAPAKAQTAVTLSPDPVAILPGDNSLTQEQADTAGWQIFAALNWPAKAGVRGVPDYDKKFGAPGLTVWETWKSPDEVFHPDGRQPLPWEVYDVQVPPQCKAIGAKEDRSTGMVLSKTVIDRVFQAAGGSLTDQNGNLVYYSISFSRPVFDFVTQNGYYNIAGQDKMTQAVDYPVGTAEMKASWRVLLPTESEQVKSRFLRRQAFVYTPKIGQAPARCRLEEVGLLGQHFNYKVTFPDGSKQWLMATFEQVDNVPPFGTPYQPGSDAGHALPYSLFDKKCYAGGCTYNQSTEQGRAPTTPTQVIRMVNIDPAAQQMNPDFQQAFRSLVPDSPWQYYQMISTQYPSTPGGGPVGTPAPALVANTTMETYVRQSSCLNCHFTARDINGKYFADYSFMLAQACPKPLFQSKPAKTSDVCRSSVK